MTRRPAVTRESLSTRNTALLAWGRRFTQLPGGKSRHDVATLIYANRANRGLEGERVKTSNVSPVTEIGRAGTLSIVVVGVLNGTACYDARFDDGTWDGGQAVRKSRLHLGLRVLQTAELAEPLTSDRHELFRYASKLGPIAVGYQEVRTNEGDFVTDEILGPPRSGAREHDLPLWHLRRIDAHLGNMERFAALVETATGSSPQSGPSAPIQLR